MSNEIERIYNSKSELMAIIIRSEYSTEGINFITDSNENMQLAYMGHKKNSSIQPHYHNKVERTINTTCETLIIRKGTLKVNFYENMQYCDSRVLNSGDVIALFRDGHGFESLTDIEMIEIKQGPYMGEVDKTRF